MPSSLLPTDPEPTQPAPGSNQSADGPVTFVPHENSGAVSGQRVVISTGRYGDIEAHELVKLLDSIEDERARGRFRESIYISVFVWLAIAWFVFYGPRVLWHAPRVKLASDVLKEREVVSLNAPTLPHVAPVPRPTPPPRVDTHTLEHLREVAPKPNASPAPSPAPIPQPANVAPATPTPQPVPEAPKPQPHTSAIPDAPQPAAHPTNPFATSNSSAPDYTHPHYPGGGEGIPSRNVIPLRGGGGAGSGTEILSDTQGVDFTAWLKRFDLETRNAWYPLLPEEVQPPLSKRGQTVLIITILPDGTVGDMKLEASTHDDAINRSAWGSITSQGKLAPLPSQFHGPNLVLRVHYFVNEMP